MVKIKNIRHIQYVIILLLLSSCKQDRVRDWEPDNMTIQIFNKNGVKCTCSSSFDDVYHFSNWFDYLLYDWHLKNDVSSLKYQFFSDSYLDFIPTDTITKTEIQNVSIELKWEENGQIIRSPLSSSIIEISASKGDRAIRIYDSTLILSSYNPDSIPEYFKLPTHKLLYIISWEYTKKIPYDVPMLTVELSIDIKSNRIKQRYKKTFYLNAKTRSYQPNYL